MFRRTAGVLPLGRLAALQTAGRKRCSEARQSAARTTSGSMASSSLGAQLPARGGFGDRHLLGRRRNLKADRAENRKRALAKRTATTHRDLLRLSTVGEQTLQKYKQAVHNFTEWCRNSKKVAVVEKNADELLTLYFSQKYLEGENPTVGRYARCGWLLLKTRLNGDKRGDYPESRKALAGWEKRAPDRVRDALPEVSLALILDWMLSNGWKEEAAVAAIQWDCYLRPSEAVELSKQSVIRPAPAAGQRYAGKWSIILGDAELNRRTKTGQVDAGVSVGAPGRKWACDLLKALVERPRADDQLFGTDLVTYERAFRLATAALSLEKLRGCPHAVRHTGPSEDRLHGRMTLAEVQQRGQWQSHSSVVRYEKHSKVLRQLAKMTPQQQQRGSIALKNLPRRYKEAFGYGSAR